MSQNRYDSKMKAISTSNWLCPRCAGYCDCAGCIRKRCSNAGPKRPKVKSSSSRLPPSLKDNTEEFVPENVSIKRDSPQACPSSASVKTEIDDVISASLSISTLPEFIRQDDLLSREASQHHIDTYLLIDQNKTDLFECPSSDTTLHSMSPYASPDTPISSHHPIIVPDASYYSHKYSQFYTSNTSSSTFSTFYDSVIPSPSSHSHVPSLINHGDMASPSPIAPPSYDREDFHVPDDNVFDFPLEEVWHPVAQCSHVSPASCTCLSSAASRLDDAETFARFINIDLLEETPSSLSTA